MTYTYAKTHESIVMVSTTAKKTIAGTSPGRVTWRKVCHQLAPSTRAASKSSSPMLARRARKTMIPKPSSFQTITIMIA
jgi:hypothetical protein